MFKIKNNKNVVNLDLES